MPSKHRKTRSQETRLKILQSARKLLVERGYHGVGLEEVARKAGISRQALYLHFASKAELLVATVRYNDEMIKVPETLRPVRDAKTALEALEAGIDAYGAIEPQIYDVASVAYSARRSDEAAEAAWQDRMAFRRGNIRQVMERLSEEGMLDVDWSVDEATDFAWALASVHMYEYLVVERGWSVEQLVARLKQVMRANLVAP